MDLSAASINPAFLATIYGSLIGIVDLTGGNNESPYPQEPVSPADILDGDWIAGDSGACSTLPLLEAVHPGRHQESHRNVELVVPQIRAASSVS